MGANLKGLSPAARRLFKRVCREWAIKDQPSIELVRQVAAILDEIAGAEEVIKREGPYVRDRFQQLRLHPAHDIIHRGRGHLVSLIRALNLDLETVADAAKR